MISNLWSTLVSSSVISTQGWQYSTSGMTWAVNHYDIDEKEYKIRIELQDGTEKIIKFKDYMQFIAYHKMIPSDCKNTQEYEEKMGVFIL